MSRLLPPENISRERNLIVQKGMTWWKFLSYCQHCFCQTLRNGAFKLAKTPPAEASATCVGALPVRVGRVSFGWGTLLLGPPRRRHAKILKVAQHRPARRYETSTTSYINPETWNYCSAFFFSIFVFTFRGRIDYFNFNYSSIVFIYHDYIQLS